VKLRTVTEYHGGPKCLTRASLAYQPVAVTVLSVILALGVLLFRKIFMDSVDLWLWIPFGFFLFLLYLRAYRLKSRVAELVLASAVHIGMTRVSRRRGKKSKDAKPESGDDSGNPSPGAQS
jgi:hypothetical protein